MTPWSDALLPAAPVPLPFLHGRYDVAPGMTRLQAPARGNAGFFVLGPDARAYLEQKLAILATHAALHRGAAPGADPRALAALLHATLGALSVEHPAWLAPAADGAFVAPALGLRYEPAGDGERATVRVARCADPAPGWERLGEGVERWLAAEDGLARLADCVALLVQEDWAVVRDAPPVGDAPGDVLEYAHVCFPSHWDPRRKLGDHFSGVHAPVASNAVLLRAHRNIVRAMVDKGPFVRHAWGIARDGRLDHHPEHAGHADARSAAPPPYLRVERQTTRGFPALDRALFTIRTYLVPLATLRRDPTAARPLAAALRGMTADERRYKGLDDADGLAEWLEGSGSEEWE